MAFEKPISFSFLDAKHPSENSNRTTRGALSSIETFACFCFLLGVSALLRM